MALNTATVPNAPSSFALGTGNQVMEETLATGRDAPDRTPTYSVEHGVGTGRRALRLARADERHRSGPC